MLKHQINETLNQVFCSNEENSCISKWRKTTMSFIEYAFILKGHWTTSASSLHFVQKNIFIQSMGLWRDHMLNLTFNFHSFTKKNMEFSFLFFLFIEGNFIRWLPLSWLLKLAPYTIYSRLVKKKRKEKKSEACVLQFLDRCKINRKL